MKKIIQFFASIPIALVLLFVFAFAMGIATFIENDYGTATAWLVVYNSRWFEIIMFLLIVCLVASIFKYRLLRREKWPVFLFHIAFVIIVLGALVTRYTSESGVMRIREQSASNVLISNNNVIKIHLKQGNKEVVFEKPLSLVTQIKDAFEWKTIVDKQPVLIRLQEFVPDAVLEIEEDTALGIPILELVVTKKGSRQTILLRKGEIETLANGETIGFFAPEATTNIMAQDKKYTIWSKNDLDYFLMSEQIAGNLPKEVVHDLKLKTLYRIADVSFVPIAFYEYGKMSLHNSNPGSNDKNKDDALVMQITVNDTTKELNLLYREGFVPTEHEITIDSVTATISYGSEIITLPFSLYLRDFQLERYPGSSSPSSYASELTIKDGTHNRPYRIFMNNVLDYDGYRFFQASYDTDERGTVLAVNRDRAGMYITYLGYFLMTVGMLFTLFGRKSYYQQLNRKLKKMKIVKTTLMLLLFFISGIIKAQELSVDNKVTVPVINTTHANLFERLLIQDLDGRIKPINTIASQFIRKVHQRDYYLYQTATEQYRLNETQIFLSMLAAPSRWQKVPFIKIAGKKLKGILSDAQITEDYLSFQDFLDENKVYLLTEAIEKANSKKAFERNETDREVLKIDERFNILYNLFSGAYLKIFPNKNDANNKWYSHIEDLSGFPTEDGRFVENVIPVYLNDVLQENWRAAHEKLGYIFTYQQTLAKNIIPSEKKVNAEIFYNRINLNFWMFQVLFTLGILMLIIAVFKVFKNTLKILNSVKNTLFIVLLVCFLCFSANLTLRWYISGHAPWSNGYEMIVFVAWSLLLFGLYFFRKSDFIIPLAALFSGALLFVSYLDWLNPEITNLMPVLKSYWLKIHVAVIVSSYAPLALSAMLGVMVTILIMIKTNRNKEAINQKIKELTYINEMSMTIGLFLLSVGTFLGGIWANESWGRYWAWDPKETWALISMIVYVIVLHFRLIPKLNNAFIINTAAIVAFWSIVMTSFGVNYFLSGLHSYAGGDPIAVPMFVYVIASALIILTIIGCWKFYVVTFNTNLTIK